MAKDKILIVRVTPQALDAYRELSKKSGVPVSVWVRKILAEAVRSGRTIK